MAKYSCRACGGPIKVSAMLNWSAAQQAPTWEGPWVHVNEADWQTDVHPARPIEIAAPDEVTERESQL